MTDLGADEDEDRLPWLEAVDEEEERDGPSPLKLIVAVLIGLIGIGLVVGGIYWLTGREPTSEGPQLIKAEKGDYKVPPDEPGGMEVEGAGDTTFAASEGVEPKGTINVDAVPEAPVTPVAKAPKPAPAPIPAVKTAPAPKPAAETQVSGSSIQLGAFSSQAAATNAWKALSGRFKYLEPLSHSITPVTVDGKTLYRLRASGPDAASLCGRLRVAGESCVTVG
jgi:hypothetical protein